MEASSVIECENRWRLEQVLHVCERQLQHMTQQALAASPPEKKSALATSLPPFLRTRVNETVDTWDVTMCHAVLQQLDAHKTKKNKNKKKQSDAAAVTAIVKARNLCAHAVGGRVTTSHFKLHVDACTRAVMTLGGDVVAVHKLRTCEIDASDVAVLTTSRESTNAAEQAKQDGNRLFRADDFAGARDRYTRGIQIAGAVDATVLAQLYNNRATTNLRLCAFDSAKEDAKHAATLAPQWAKPHLRLAEIYHATYKPHKAVARLEIALGHAGAANDTAMEGEVTAKIAEYRLDRDQATRRESENLAYGPLRTSLPAMRAASQASQGLHESQDPMALFHRAMTPDFNGTGRGAKKHVLLGQFATQDGRLADAAREFLAAAVGGDPEGMYNYAVCQMYGRGTRKNLPEAVSWLEKAAAMPTSDLSSRESYLKNVGIGEALASLGNLYSSGIHFAQDKLRAREYWERSAALGVNTGLNNFGLCLMNGSFGVPKDLPRARDLFRRSAELLHNEAMSNLGLLHASLQEYESAARWADSAAKFGFVPASTRAAEYRKSAAALATLPDGFQELLAKFPDTSPTSSEQITIQRNNETPTLAELQAIGSPYGNRLLAAKQLMANARQALEADSVQALDFVIQAHRIDDCELVLSQDEVRVSYVMAMVHLEIGMPLTADLALLMQPKDPSATVAFWKSMQLQFPTDLEVTKRTACVHMFSAYAGADIKYGVSLFQRAFTLLPHPNDDSDPRTLDLLYVAGVAYFQIQELKIAEGLLTRFLKYAPVDGHRKGSDAHYILGAIAMAKFSNAKRQKSHSLDISLMAKHLREGDLLLQRKPAFLRGDTQTSPYRELIAGILESVDSVARPRPASLSTSLLRRRGGELLDGPRRHAELRSDSPTLQPMWRAEIAVMAGMSARLSTTTSSSTTPPRKSTRANRSGKWTDATIDELFSALEDRVYTWRQLKCVVVSLPSFNGSSFQCVVEDSQREPARIAVYNAPPSMIAQLVPGRALRLFNPYVRLAFDHSVMLRVDDPSATIEVETLHVVCWVCSIEQTGQETLKRCAKCKTATYCSKQCQTHDWSLDGHRFLCSTVRQAL